MTYESNFCFLSEHTVWEEQDLAEMTVSKYVYSRARIIHAKIRENFVQIKRAYELSAHPDRTKSVSSEVFCTG